MMIDSKPGPAQWVAPLDSEPVHDQRAEEADRSRNAIAVQADIIDTLTAERDVAVERVGIDHRRLAAAAEYIGWLERQLNAAREREQ